MLVMYLSLFNSRPEKLIKTDQNINYQFVLWILVMWQSSFTCKLFDAFPKKFFRNQCSLYCQYCQQDRSSHRRCSIEKGVLENFAKFTGKHMCQNLIFNEVVDLGPAVLLKKRLWHRDFSVNFAKFLRTPFLHNTSGTCFWTRVILLLIFRFREKYLYVFPKNICYHWSYLDYDFLNIFSAPFCILQ